MPAQNQTANPNGGMMSAGDHIGNLSVENCANTSDVIENYGKGTLLGKYSAEDYNRYGEECAEKGDDEGNDAAYICFHMAACLDPSFSKPRFNLGKLYSLYGKNSAANGRNAAAEDYYNEATNWYLGAITTDPNFTDAYVNIGEIYKKKPNGCNLATQYYKKAIELDPACVQAYDGLGEVYTMQGNYKDAEESLLNAIKYCKKTDISTCAMLYNHLGYIYSRQSDTIAKGETCIKKAIEIDPKFVRAYISLGVLYLNQKRLDEAIECFNRCIEYDKGNAKAYCNLGITCTAQGKYGEAKQNFDKAFNLCKETKFAALIKLNCGVMYRMQGNWSKAIENYEEAIAFDKGLLKAHIQLKDAYVNNGDQGKAAQCEEQIDEICQKLANAFNITRDVQGERDRIGYEQLNQQDRVQHVRERAGDKQNGNGVKMNMRRGRKSRKK